MSGGAGEPGRTLQGMIRSPCVQVCALDINDICIGCFRTGREIAEWGAMSEAQKAEVLREVARREAESGRLLSD